MELQQGHSALPAAAERVNSGISMTSPLKEARRRSIEAHNLALVEAQRKFEEAQQQSKKEVKKKEVPPWIPGRSVSPDKKLLGSVAFREKRAKGHHTRPETRALLHLTKLAHDASEESFQVALGGLDSELTRIEAKQQKEKTLPDLEIYRGRMRRMKEQNRWSKGSRCPLTFLVQESHMAV